MISMKEEVEQDVIGRSVSVDIENKVTIASLPFIDDPFLQLGPNRDRAMSVYLCQLRKLNKDIKSKEEVITSEMRLQTLGHVEYMKNLCILRFVKDVK